MPGIGWSCSCGHQLAALPWSASTLHVHSLLLYSQPLYLLIQYTPHTAHIQSRATRGQYTLARCPLLTLRLGTSSSFHTVMVKLTRLQLDSLGGCVRRDPITMQQRGKSAWVVLLLLPLLLFLFLLALFHSRKHLPLIFQPWLQRVCDEMILPLTELAVPGGILLDINDAPGERKTKKQPANVQG